MDTQKLERTLVVLLVAVIVLAILAVLLVVSSAPAQAAELVDVHPTPALDLGAVCEFAGIIAVVLLAAMWMGNHKR
jgi:hypothetical protein